MTHDVQMRKKIIQMFRSSGIAARSQAVAGIESVLRAEEDPDKTLKLILSKIKSKGRGMVDVATVEEIIAELSRDDEDASLTRLTVFDAFNIPHFKYSTSRKQFVKETSAPNEEASMCTRLFRQRFEIIRQRLARNSVFASPLLCGSLAGRSRRVQDAPPSLELTEIESLEGGDKGDKFVLGLLSKLSNGQFYLEDLNSRIQVNVTNASISNGMITEGCIVLCEGRVRDRVFVVDTMGLPPAERRNVSLNAHGGMDFVLGDAISEEVRLENEKLCSLAEDANFIILSDVHLDSQDVLNQLTRIFETYESCEPAPALFCLMGNFLSKPFGEGDGQCGQAVYKQAWESLADILSLCPRLLKESQFLFIPGPADPSSGCGNVLPRASIPKYFSRHITDNILSVEPDARFHFGTNPCRVRFFSQELVFFREELIGRLRRNCVIAPSDDHTLPTHLCRTITQQSHLCPLPLHVQPVMWPYDNSLSLYPLPHVVIAAEQYDQYEKFNQGCQVINPGAFSLDFSFVVYYPATKTCEFSKINPEDDREPEDE